MADVRLAVRNLATPGLLPSTFDVHGGEILGIAGVGGYRQIELAEALAGLRRANDGAIGCVT